MFDWFVPFDLSERREKKCSYTFQVFQVPAFSAADFTERGRVIQAAHTGLHSVQVSSLLSVSARSSDFSGEDTSDNTEEDSS